ncbi:MAG: histone deacetylase [Burkholderiales bacterium]|nr:histone deacetylase [Phycisphaerae bacterium]
MVGFVSSPRCVEHDTGPHHPERPDRLRAIHRAVRDARLIESPDPFPEFEIDLGIASQLLRLAEIAPKSATESDARLIHPQRLIDNVKHSCEFGAVLDMGDTPTCAASFEIALLSLGCAITAADAVARGDCRRAFAAARPPGHHAEPDRSMGFCFFSNIAIVARHLQRAYGMERIAIVDFDVHHGNGTQACFEDDPSVLFVSLHEHPSTLYPGSGQAWEVGDGPGRGTTLNIPLNPGGGDTEYLAAIDAKVLPAIDKYKPDILLVSAGFDAHADDPLAHMQVSDDGFEQITRRLVQAAEIHTGGRLVSVLEGGYNLVALGRSVVRHLIALADPI